MKPINSTVWQDVKTDIESKILNGTFSAGKRIPSIRKISEDYGVGQSTAQKILNVLEQEGIVESRRGVGYFVMPYIRERLISERKKDLERTVLHAIDEAELMGIDLASMLEKCKRIKK